MPNWLFLACFGDNAQAAAGAQYATDQLGARTAAVLYDKDLDYTRLLARYFERSFRAQGGKVLATADFTKPALAVRRLESAGASAGAHGVGSGTTGSAASTAIELGQGEGRSGSSRRDGSTESRRRPASRPPEHRARRSLGRRALRGRRPRGRGPLVRGLRAAGFGQPIMGGDSFDTPELIAAAEKTGGKVYYTTHAAVGLSTASRAVRRFEPRTRRPTGSRPRTRSRRSATTPSTSWPRPSGAPTR